MLENIYSLMTYALFIWIWRIFNEYFMAYDF